MKLQGYGALVTGGGRGIGHAIALACAREGADVAVAARTVDEVEATADEIRQIGRRAIAIRTDVSDRAQVDAMVERVVQAFGRIDVLVNNAGMQGPIGPLIENDVDAWIRTIHVNLIGTFLCTRAVLPVMIQQRRGKILNLSGGGATAPRSCFSAYSASKAAVVRFTETVAEEVKGYTIQVNAMAPGAVNTRLLQEVLEAGEAAGEQALRAAQKQLETGGVPPERAAALAVFLASEASDGLTGRLISAVYDEWEHLTERIPEIMDSDLYTLRRVTTT